MTMPDCLRCIYFRKSENPDRDPTCNAFPAGIPRPILLGLPAVGLETDSNRHVIHSEHYEGQVPGFLFAEKPEEAK